MKALLDLGVDCFKVHYFLLRSSTRTYFYVQTDFGERIPHASVQFHDGSDPVRMHNLYSVLYNELVFNILKERFGQGEAVVFARSGSVGSQRCVSDLQVSILECELTVIKVPGRECIAHATNSGEV